MKNLEVCKNCWLKDDCNDSGYSCTNSFCVKNFKLSKLYDNALISLKQRQRINWFPTDSKEDANNFKYLASVESNIMNFVDQGGNLYIHSPITGNGKTSWAFRLARSYINNSWFKKPLETIVLFISVPKFLLELKSNITQKSEYVEHILDSVRSCDLVIWDDIGSKNGTEFEVSYLLSIIDDRLTNSKSNIYTSNLNRDELHTLLGDRVYSRVYNYSECIEFVGKDKRGVKKKKK